MSAVITRPRSRKVAPAPSIYKRPEQDCSPAVATAPVYSRPVNPYVVNDKDALPDRIETLRASFYSAEEKMEAAYDASEHGTAADRLLEFIAHDLLVELMHPLMRPEDEKGDFCDRLPLHSEAEAAHERLFVVLAALEGVLCLSLGKVIYSTLVEVFEHLDWAQEELEDLVLHRLLPEVEKKSSPCEAASNIMWDALGILESSTSILSGRLADLDRGAGYGARTLMRVAHDRITLALAEQTTDHQNEASVAFHEAVEVLAVFAEKVDDSATWGALTLLELAKEKLDSSIGTLPEVANA